MRRIAIVAAVVGTLSLGGATLAWLTRPVDPPDFAAVKAAHLSSEAWLLDRHGEVIDTRRLDLAGRRLEWTPLQEISPALVAAVIAGEDRRFRQHGGVDWRGVAGAARDALHGRRRGASTITMQLAAMLSPAEAGPRAGGRGVPGKLRQMRLALQLGRRWSRDQVLEAYLNRVSFRGELQGVAAAAWRLAGKSPAGLSGDEAAVLAALLPQPGASPQRVAQRACARLAAADCTTLQDTARRLLDGAQQAVANENHLAPQLAAALLRAPGERLRTTLDAQVQRVAIQALARQLEGLAGRNVRDAAAIVVDNESGEVLAYVGSAGRASSAAQVDGVRALRQAGSTLKPFLYGLAFERRWLTAASLLDDSPVAIDTASGLYLPRDYDHDYKGPVSARTALAGSLNVPAVRVLMLTGVDAFRDRLNALGYDSIDRDGEYYGFSLALGSAEVSLWAQARAYRALARGGEISGLRLRQGEAQPDPHAVLAPGAAWLVGSILADRGARAVTFGLDSALATPYWSAVKTGTSKDLRDNWCIGYSPAVTVAVWVGNFEGDGMQGVSGISGAAPAWREIMDALHAHGAPRAPSAPPGLRRQPLRYADGVEPSREEWFLTGTSPGPAVQPVDSRSRLVRIRNPVNGMVIALDPDIPPAAQRVPLAAEGTGAGHRLLLDDQELGDADGRLLWAPTPGAHRLALVDAQGRILDRILFTVR